MVCAVANAVLEMDPDTDFVRVGTDDLFPGLVFDGNFVLSALLSIEGVLSAWGNKLIPSPWPASGP